MSCNVYELLKHLSFVYGVAYTDTESDDLILAFNYAKILVRETKASGFIRIIVDEPTNTVMIGFAHAEKVYLVNRLFIASRSKDRLFASFKNMDMTYEEYETGLRNTATFSVLSVAQIEDMANLIVSCVFPEKEKVRFEDICIYKREKAVMYRPPNPLVMPDPDHSYIENFNRELEEKRHEFRQKIAKCFHETRGDALLNILHFYEDLLDAGDRDFYFSCVTFAENLSEYTGVNHLFATAMERYYYTAYTPESQNLYRNMFCDFFDKVNKLKVVDAYSMPVKKAVDYIEGHLSENIDTEELSVYCGVSSGYLLKRFKKEAGVSLVDYIQYWKIQLAKNYLEYSNYSMAEISDILSFSTQSYFTFVFKKYEHMTPAKYRKDRIKGNSKA